jgi:hypothetical protein
LEVYWGNAKQGDGRGALAGAFAASSATIPFWISSIVGFLVLMPSAGLVEAHAGQIGLASDGTN